MRISGIYKIQSIIKPERCYIGSAIHIKNRWADHLRGLRNNKHANSRFQNHYNKYGKDDFIFTVIEPCLPEFLIIREQHYIDSLNPFFNICKNAGSVLGLKKTPESCKKQSETYRGEDHPMFGRNHTEESKNSMSKGHEGQKAWNKGLKMSPEFCKSNSESHKGIKASTETRKKMSEAHAGEKNSMYGKKQSEESNRKNRESQLGEKSWNYGKHHSQESINKMKVAKKEYWRLKKQNLVA